MRHLKTCVGEKGEMMTITKWAAIRRGDGKVTGYIEVFYSKNLNRFVTIPGVSRFRNA
ncbi:MAG: hypothetical protein ABI972_11335 [Acidobacteriota bacterium]